MVNQRLMKILNDFKIELTVYLRGHKFEEHAKIDKKMWEDLKEYEKNNLADNPLWNSMMKIGEPKSELTPLEKKFMNSNLYKGWMKIMDDAYIASKKADKLVIRQLKEGTASEKDKKIIDDAEMTIWKTHEKFHGEKSADNLPVITFDSDFYEAINYSGRTGGTDEKLRQRLNAIGYDYEPYDASTWDIYADSSLKTRREKGKAKKSRSRDKSANLFLALSPGDRKLSRESESREWRHVIDELKKGNHSVQSPKKFRETRNKMIKIGEFYGMELPIERKMHAEWGVPISPAEEKAIIEGMERERLKSANKFGDPDYGKDKPEYKANHPKNCVKRKRSG